MAGEKRGPGVRATAGWGLFSLTVHFPCVAADLDDHAGHVVGELVLAREVAHGPMEGLDDPARGLAAVGPDDVDRTLGAEKRPIGADGLDDAVGQQQDEVAGLERDGLGLGEIGLVGDSQRQAGAAEDGTDRPVVPQDVAGRVPGVRVDQGARGRIEAGQEQGDEPAVVDVRGEGTVGQRRGCRRPARWSAPAPAGRPGSPPSARPGRSRGRRRRRWRPRPRRPASGK